MLAIERQEQIVSQIRRDGAVRIHELTKQFGVSVETIRRDLLELERQDCLHRVHGGAVGIAVAKQYHRLEERTEENPQKKEELSGYAAGLIREVLFREQTKLRLTLAIHSLSRAYFVQLRIAKVKRNFICP